MSLRVGVISDFVLHFLKHMHSDSVFRKLHCRMWHSIPDMPLLLSVRKRWVAMVCVVVQGCHAVL